jgi:hypothetical protein
MIENLVKKSVHHLAINDERIELYQKIINNALEGKKPSNFSQVLFFFGGPGAGKSPLLNIFKDKDISLENAVVINMDIFKGISAFANYPNSLHPEKEPELVDEYYYLMKEIAKAAISKGLSVIIDDHGDYIEPYEQIAQVAKKNNYQVSTIGITMTPYNYIARQEKTELKARNNGKPFVDRRKFYPEALKLHKTFQHNFEKYLVPLTDNAFLYDNSMFPANKSPDNNLELFPPRTIPDSSNTYRMVAIYEKDSVSKEVKTDIVNRELYNRFQEWENTDFKKEILPSIRRFNLLTQEDVMRAR